MSTPPPWKVFTSPDGLKLVGIGSAEGEGICDAGFGVWRWNDADGVANANLIVRAVNCHDDLLAALKECLLEHGGYTIRGGCERRAKAAIAKAEGTP